jgi:hypothetical protein
VTYLGESLKWNHGMESWRRLRLDRGGCVFRVSLVLKKARAALCADNV